MSTLRGILVDLDGVVYNGEQPIAGAAETVEWLRAQGFPYLFVTNTTSRPRSALVAKLAAFGVRADESQILTPGLVVAACPLCRMRWNRARPTWWWATSATFGITAP